MEDKECQRVSAMIEECRTFSDAAKHSLVYNLIPMLTEEFDRFDTNIPQEKRINVPSGKVTKASWYRKQMPESMQEVHKEKCTRYMMGSDVLYWFLTRFYIWGYVFSTLMLNYVVIVASVVEHIINHLDSANKPFKKKVERLVRKGTLSEELAERLITIWEQRSIIHARRDDPIEFTSDQLRTYRLTVRDLLTAAKR